MCFMLHYWADLKTEDYGSSQVCGPTPLRNLTAEFSFWHYLRANCIRKRHINGFTAFAETAEPEEVLDLLCEYHGALGPVVAASEGTLDHFSGDGIMVFFNNPVPDASERAVRMAIE